MVILQVIGIGVISSHRAYYGNSEKNREAWN
ncbi:unnamed protein product, partial [marine sediment metagenome]